MAFLELSRNKKLKVGLTFEAPDDDMIQKTADPDVDTGSHADMGLTSFPIATLTVVSKSPITEDTTLFMTMSELRRHISECRTVLQAAPSFTENVDNRFSSYIDNVRSEEKEIIMRDVEFEKDGK